MPRGFTVVEFLIVVCLVGVVAAAMLPQLTSSTQEEELAAAAVRVNAAIEYAREVAAASGRPTRVTVDPGANTVLLETLQYTADLMGAGAEVAEAAVDSVRYVALPHPARPAKHFALAFAEEPALQEVDVTSSNITAADPLLFDGAGVGSKEATVGLQAGTHTAEVKVEPRLPMDSGVRTAIE